jgi:hypothetical protein
MLNLLYDVFEYHFCTDCFVNKLSFTQNVMVEFSKAKLFESNIIFEACRMICIEKLLECYVYLYKGCCQTVVSQSVGVTSSVQWCSEFDTL